ncbi:MAG: glycosyltransferase family 4 protein, partial [Anaerolineales bacterium]|nr:glycosyltransferase family 4 protein [Anaerolineales bacterium]
LEELELSTFYEAYAHEHALTRRIRSGLTWGKASRYYRRILEGYAASTVVSEDEKQVVQHVTPPGHRLEVVPNGIDLAHYRDLESQHQEHTILYCGSLTYDANFDAVSFFLDEIFPQILDAHPQAKLRVTGGLHGVELDKLPRSEQVEFTGYLEDVRPIIAKSWVSVVPLRIGGGTRLKILESLAMGTPVIATRKGAQGLAIQSGEGMLIADSPQQFGEYVIDVLEQPELQQALSMAGKISVRTYDWERIGPQFNRLVLDIAQSKSVPKVRA